MKKKDDEVVGAVSPDVSAKVGSELADLRKRIGKLEDAVAVLFAVFKRAAVVIRKLTGITPVIEKDARKMGEELYAEVNRIAPSIPERPDPK